MSRRPAPRHPVRAGPDRAEDAAQPLLPGAALHRLRRREAVDAGGVPRHEGRGRLGGGLHRVLLDQPRDRRVRRTSRRGSGTTRTCARCALMTEEAHAHGALAGVELWHGGLYAEARESRAAAARAVARSRATSTAIVGAARRWTLADIRRVAGRVGRRRPPGARRPASTSSTCTARTPTCRRSSSRRVYNRRTDAYGGSFENRARFWLEAIELVREAVGDDCAIAVRIAADTLEGVGRRARGGPRVHPPRPSRMVDLWDVTIGALVGLAAGRQPARRGSSSRATSSSGRARAREATAKPIVVVGRFTDPDLMAEVVRERRGRPDRRRPAVDLRPVPAEQDRAGPLRRDPRVHRLQRLLLALDLGPPPGLHAERDRGRGAPPRLASRSGSTARRTPIAARSCRRRAGRAWSARSCWPSAASSACTSSTPATTSAAACAG